MAPPVTASESYGHCLKKFSLDGAYLGSIGTCAANAGASEAAARPAGAPPHPGAVVKFFRWELDSFNAGGA